MVLKTATRAAVLALLLGASVSALADNAKTLNAPAQRVDRVPRVKAQTLVLDRTAAQFANFAGSPSNAENLVNGLRNGMPIMLIGGSPPETVAFSVPTKPMGNGNVLISMSLTQQQLAKYGITNPTPSQIEAAMVGGTIMVNGQPQSLQGVLAMRADGMGWGQIAQAMGTKLGPVVSGIKAANNRQAAQVGAASGGKPASGIVTAGGASSSNARGGHGNGRGSGIVTANGTPADGGAGGNHAGGYGQGSGIVTAAGASGGASGHGNAGGAHGKGR